MLASVEPERAIMVGAVGTIIRRGADYRRKY
jgi:hypothetical protein